MKSLNQPEVKEKRWIPAFAGMTRSALIITAATIGSGIFALPYVIAESGWLLTLIYYFVLGTMVVAAHTLYFKTLAAEGEKERLLGLTRKYFGAPGFWFGFIGIVVGLLLSFVIFLILGTQFILLIFPSLHYLVALFIFWLVVAIPALLSNRRVTGLETLSVVCVTAIILFVFITSRPTLAFANIPAVRWQNIFLPFNVILFTLAGWTGIEPFYEKDQGETLPRRDLGKVSPSIALGTAFAILLYWLFATGILGSAPQITGDTISGLTGWPIWKRDLIAIFGLFAIATVAMPISHELRNALEKDLRWSKLLSRMVIVILPLLTVLAGFRSLLLVIGLAGGLFVSMEYILIIAVGRRALNLSAVQRRLLDLISLIFFAAAVYEIAGFIVK